MTNQLDVRKLYKACEPSRTLNMSNSLDRQYYTDFASVRGGKIIEKIERTIWSKGEEPTCQLFTGHIGCGKSTELRKLEENLKKRSYHVVYFESTDDLDMGDVDITDILLAIARQVSKNFQESYGIPLRPGRFSTVLENIRQSLKIEFTGGIEIDLPGKLAKINLAAKASPGLRSRLRQCLEPQTSTILEIINEQLLGEARKTLKKLGKEDLVVIIDDLDRVDNRQMSNSNRTQPEYLFIDRGNELNRLNCHIIYTIPLVLLYSDPQNLNQRFGQGIPAKILPMVPVELRSGGDHAEGLNLLRQMVMKRAFPDASLDDRQRRELIPEVFERPDTLLRLCRVSGGHARNLLAMLQSCLQGEDPPLSRDGLESVIRDYRDSLLGAITPDELELLRQVKQQQSVSGVKEQQALLRTLYAYEYHDTEGKWYKINPILLESDKIKNLLAQ
jgi:energy-coupling factor transporter ATP-binding protein EcfA2